MYLFQCSAALILLAAGLVKKTDNLKKLNDVMAENEDLKRQVDDLTTELNTIKLEQYELDNLRELFKNWIRNIQVTIKLQQMLSEKTAATGLRILRLTRDLTMESKWT